MLRCVLVVVWWSLCGSMWALSLRRPGYSSCGTRVPKYAGSAVAGPGLGCPEACGILVYWPGIKPESPVMEGRFLTTGPPVKSWASFYRRGNLGTECLLSFLVILTMIQALKTSESKLLITCWYFIFNTVNKFIHYWTHTLFFFLYWVFPVTCLLWLPRGPMVKNPPANAREARDMGSAPQLGRLHGVENGNQLQYSWLEN